MVNRYHELAETLALLTSKRWRDRLTQSLLISPLLAGDANTWLSYYVSRDKPTPAWVGRAIIEERKPKKGGRHTHVEERARQRASDIAASLAVEFLLATGVGQTRACLVVGELMNLTCQAVSDAWKREKTRETQELQPFGSTVLEKFCIEDEDDYDLSTALVDEMDAKTSDFNELLSFIRKSA